MPGNTGRGSGATVADRRRRRAFLAMTQYRLGQREQAESSFARLREAVQNPRWSDDEGSRRFVREVEVLICGRSPDLPEDVFAR
jgi:hypothetical protein